MTKVSLVRCHEYSHEVLKEKIVTGLKDIGFDVQAFHKKRIALKPNLLLPASVEKAVVTNPEFVGAVASIVKQYGGTPVIIESPMMTSLESTMKKSGYNDMIKNNDIEVVHSTEAKVLFYEGTTKYKRFEISKALFDVDLIINLPKFKTHGITYISGAVKNLFGTIPGIDKSKWHLKASTPIAFSELLLDLCEALMKGFEKPKKYLHIMDAIIGQEKAGPGPAGTPKQIGAIVIGENPIAVDYVAVCVVGLAIHNVHTITAGFNRELGVHSPADIEIIGETIAALKLTDFVPTNHAYLYEMGTRWPMNTNTFRNIFTEKPVPLEKKCTLCYQCKKICPAVAISEAIGKKKVPLYDYQTCIRCYCCKEICPQAAISLKKGALQFLIEKSPARVRGTEQKI